MANRVYVNVEDYRLIDGKTVVEDVTQVGLPTIKKKTTTVSAAGMVADIDMPNATRYEAMDYTIQHNNGMNHKALARPGKHTQEFRTVRQYYDTEKSTMKMQSVKFRLTGVHVETQKGNIETGSPYGSTDRYSLLRYEEEINGSIVQVIDVAAGVVKYDGKEYTDEVNNLLK